MRLLILALSIIGILASSNVAKADRRVAFVVGNGAYKNVTPLPNPPIDARAICGACRWPARAAWADPAISDSAVTPSHRWSFVRFIVLFPQVKRQQWRQPDARFEKAMRRRPFDFRRA